MAKKKADAAPAADPSDAAPAEPLSAKSGGSKLQAVRGFLARNITLTTKEWLHSLLYQPTDPPFRFDADFKNELGRVVRLIVAVLTISAILVGGLDIFTGKVDMVQTVKDSITVFIIAILISIIFLPCFYVCGVRIISKSGGDKPAAKKALSFAQIFFTVLYTFVPWMPVLAFIQASVVAAEGIFYIDFLLIAPFLCFVYMFVNFSKSMKLITDSSYLRIWAAASIPIVLLLAYLLF